MIRVSLFCFACLLWAPFWGSSVLAQGLDGRAERLLEDQLSGPGRDVEISGFEGTFSTRASFERLTMSDAQGAWLVLENGILDWTASALLRGRLQVDELSATLLDIRRLPASEPDPIAASEASGFRIPDLPIAINIGRAGIEEIRLGAPLLGTAVRATFEGAARLEDGGLFLTIAAERRDGPGGVANIALSYAPSEEMLSVDADIREPAGGILARALGLPGLPSVEFRAEGSGQLDAFTSTIRLSTDDVERFGGQVSLTGVADGTRQFEADLRGDIRPLLAPESQPFFGAATGISASGQARPSGEITLDTLRVDAARLSLTGTGALAADGVPSRLSLSGQVTGDLPGGAVTLRQGQLSVSFDAAQGPDWSFALISDDARFPGGSVARATVEGQGRLEPGTDTPFAGDISVSTMGLVLDDAALTEALGRQLALQTDLAVGADGRVDLSDLLLSAGPLSASGSVAAIPRDGFVALTADLLAEVPDLGALGELVAPVRAGTARAQLKLDADFPGGSLAVAVTGETNGLDIGQEALKPVLEPETALTLRMSRTEAGTEVETLELENSALSLTAEGSLSTRQGGLTLDGLLRDPAALLSGLPPGPLRVTGRIDDVVTQPNARLALTHDTGTRADVTARLDGQNADFDIVVDMPALAPFADLLAPLERGAAQAQVTGRANMESGAVTAQLSATTRGISIGNAVVLPVLEPESVLQATLTRRADGTVTVEPVSLRNPELSAEATGRLAPDGETVSVELTAQLRRPTLFVTDLPNGALDLSGRVEGVLSAPRARLSLSHAAGAEAILRARLDDGRVNFDTEARIPELARFAALLGPVRRGAASAQIAGTAELEQARVSVRVSAQTIGLETAITPLNPLTRPDTRLAAVVTREADGRSFLRDVALRSSALEVEADAEIGADGAVVRADLASVVTDLAQIAPDLPGRLALDASLVGDRITAQLNSVTGASAQVSGRIGLPGNTVDLSATGSAPLALAGPFIGNRAISGNAGFDLALRGGAGLNAVSGQVSSSDLRFTDPALGLVLDPGQMQVDLSGGRAQLVLTGLLNGAPLDVRGGAGLSAPFQTDVSLSLRDLDYALQDIARLNVSSDLTLSGRASERLAVAGDIRLGRSEFRIPDGLGGVPAPPPVRHLGASSGVLRTLERAGLAEQTESAGGATPRVSLDLTIRALEPIFVRGRGLDAEFGGEIQLRGDVAEPVPSGEFTLRRGRLNLLGQRLNVTDGQIKATGGLIPDLNIVATSQTDKITARVALTGPADAPELELSSEPQLPQDEVLAQLLFGRDVSSLSAFQVAQLIASLQALTSGRPTLFEQSRSAFGVDDFDLRTDAATGQAELAIGNYLTENLYSEVEIGAEGDTQVNLNLDLTENTKLRGSVDSEGGSGVGVFWERDY